MSEESSFPDVHELLQASRPRATLAWLWLLLLGLGMFALLGSYAVDTSTPAGQATQALIGLSAMLLMAGMLLVMFFVVRAQRHEQQAVQAIDEMVRLRRWPQAAEGAVGLLSKPMRHPLARTHVLVLLSGILMRYERFADALEVTDHLLEGHPLDGSTLHALHVGRALAMLRMDHLVDADRAIIELRRQVARAQSMADEQTTDDDPTDSPVRIESAGLTLVEMYRDVKTGHPREAIDLFNRKRTILRDQLGHRLADGLGMAAHAHHMLGDGSQAQLLWYQATLLTPVTEIVRRYPELASISRNYPPAVPPRGAA